MIKQVPELHNRCTLSCMGRVMRAQINILSAQTTLVWDRIGAVWNAVQNSVVWLFASPIGVVQWHFEIKNKGSGEFTMFCCITEDWRKASRIQNELGMLRYDKHQLVAWSFRYQRLGLKTYQNLGKLSPGQDHVPWLPAMPIPLQLAATGTLPSFTLRKTVKKRRYEVWAGMWHSLLCLQWCSAHLSLRERCPSLTSSLSRMLQCDGHVASRSPGWV